MTSQMHSGASGSRNRKTGVILSYVYTLAQIVVNLLYVPLLLRGIGIAEYGLYTLIGSVIAYMAIMNTMFSSGTTRFYCKYYAENNPTMMENSLAICRLIYGFASGLSIAIGAAAIVIVRTVYAQSLTEFQLFESSVMLATLVANLIITMQNSINVAIINTHERFAFLKATQLISVVIQPIAIICLVESFPYAVTITFVQFGMNAACCLAQRLFARQVLKGKVKLHSFDKDLLKSLLKYSTGILTVLVADQIFWKTNQLILGYYLGTTAVAVYGVASQITTAYAPLGTAISSVYMPRVSELLFGEKNEKSVSELFIKVGRISFFVLMLVLTGFVVFGKDFIRLWAGESFDEAYWIALIIMVPYTIDLVQNIALIILQVQDKYYFRGKVTLAIAVLNVVFVVLIVPHYGSIGAAVVTAIALFLGDGVVMNWYYSRKTLLDVKGFWLNIAQIAAPLAVLMMAAWVAARFMSLDFNWPLLVSMVFIYCILYAAVAYYCCANDEEKRLVQRFLKRAKP